MINGPKGDFPHSPSQALFIAVDLMGVGPGERESDHHAADEQLFPFASIVAVPGQWYARCFREFDNDKVVTILSQGSAGCIVLTQSREAGG